jgi:flagellar hook-associated protein 2
MASTTSTTGTVLTGLASGIDWTTLITAMASAERAPETAWKAQITSLTNQNTDYQTIGTDLSKLQNDVSTLSDPSFFESATTSSSNSGVATATASEGTTPGNYNLVVSQLATATSVAGTTVTAQPISATTNVNGITLGSTSFAAPISAGTFTVNGKTITVQTSDTLQSVFDQISTATGGAVTASYDPTSDKITLQSAGAIQLGTSADTSNFLSATGLFSNGTGTVTSANTLGAVNIYSDAADSGLSTAITDGGNGAGSLTINGVTINYDASTDSINDILSNINASGAGVTASYDSVNHHFSLTNNNTGSLGITMSDNTGNFLAATGLSGGTATQGQNLQYTINGSATLTSQSNTITGSQIGITGLSITAQDTGNATISVTADTSTIATAITNFVTDYNTVQNYISAQTATTTDSNGNTVGGVLTGDFDIEQISTKLRSIATAISTNLTGSVKGVNDMGITSNGQNNTLTLDSTTLNKTLSTNLAAVSQIFSNPTNGLGTQLNTYLLKTIGGNGPLISGEQSFSSQITSLNASITQLESKVSIDETNMQSEFVAMEDAINKANTDKQYLTAYFSTASASAAPAASSINSGSSSSSSSSSGG